MINLHIRNGNLGDLVCPPSLYFQFNCESLINLLSPAYPVRDVIFGGGGMIYCEDEMKAWLDVIFGKTISWGIGHNRHNTTEVIYPVCMDQFTIHGVRDWNMGYPWVPCASCMYSGFDKKYEITRDYVVYAHREVPLNVENFPSMTNAHESFDEVLSFLGSAEVILTNTYHGAYWGVLLGRKVLIIDPFSTRFLHYKHQPKTVSIDAWKEKDIPIFPEALSECREANIKYYEKFKNLDYL